MKLGQKLAILTIAASISLFANGITNVTSLVDQINKTSDIKAKQVLMKKLDIEIASIDQKDLAKAKEIIDTNLKK